MTYWIIHIAALGLLSYLGSRFLVKELPPAVFWLGLGLKLTAGIILGFIFLDYYGSGDTIAMFEAAKSDAVLLRNEPRTAFFIKLIRPIVQLSGGSYWITSMWISFVSFLGCWFAAETLSKLYGNIKYIIAVCFLFIPTIVFWSSGLMKDALIFAALSLAVSIVVKFYQQQKLSIADISILAFSVFLLFQLKHYILITFILFSAILMSSVIFKKVKGKLKWPLALILFVLLIGSTQFVHPYLTVNRLSWALYENNRIIHGNGSSRFDLVIENESLLSVLKEVPKALHAGLFRPSLLDQTAGWGWIHRIENFILTVLIFLSLMLLVRLRPKINVPLIITAVICILILAIMLSLTTPNFGSLVRYKNAYLPYLFLISSILPYRFLTSKSIE